VKENLVLIQEKVDGENSEWYNVYEDGSLLVSDWSILLILIHSMIFTGLIDR